ncbi:hypothetical protein NFI96_022063 [Prochilodus magdalenae]|nr:hypothetical protein NFI96_022063 [Prochilodus magdalenae]
MINTHFINAYLSRADTSDPGCVANVTDMKEWIEKNFGVLFENAKETLNMNAVVRATMMSRTFNIIRVHFSEFSRGNWSDWFNSKLVLLLPSLTTEMLKTILAEADCTIYHVIVEGLNMVFDEMTLNTKQEITLVFIHYLKESRKISSSGSHIPVTSPCGSSTNTVSAWLWVNFGKYSIYVTLGDLQSLNDECSSVRQFKHSTDLPVIANVLQPKKKLINVFFVASQGSTDTTQIPTFTGERTTFYVSRTTAEKRGTTTISPLSLELLTPSQVADLALHSGALNNREMMNAIFKYLEEGNALQNIKEFLNALVQHSQTIQIHPLVRDIMMEKTFSLISGHFSEFSKADWIDWFDRKLVPLLPSLTAEMLSITLAEVDCGTYHVIIEGLNMAFEEMTLATKQQITLVLVEYLKKSHEVDDSGSLPCRSDTKSASSWLWLSFGRYSIYVTLQDLQLLNHEFSKFTSLKVFTVSQVCDLTIQSGALQNVDLINVVFNRLEEGSVFKNLEKFLEALGPNSQTLEISPAVRDIMMKWTFNIISSHFSEFSKAHWIDWFGSKLVPLLPSLTTEMLSITLAEVDCGTYHVIIEGLNMAFEKMTLTTKQQITLVLVEYLKRSHEVDDSGSLPCRSDTKSASSWLWLSFGRYSIYVTLQDLQLLNHEFSKFTSLEVFTVSQVCDLTIQSGALQNVDLINVVINRLEEGSVFKNLEEFLEALGPNSQTLEISHAVRDIMMKWTFNIISSHFSEFSKAHWIDWFGSKLVPLLPSLTTEMLSITLAEVDCGTYHVIIEGLNMAFEEMTLATKQQITLVLVEYLKRSHEVDDSGSLPCRSDTKSASSWLWLSFGRYSIYVTLQDLQLLNHEFSKFTSLEVFTVSQVCDLTIQSGALQNVDLINVVFNRLEEGSVFKNLEKFLEALGPNSQTVEISPAVRDIMMKWTFNIISSHFSEFSKADWIDWFGSKLVRFLPSLTTEMLSITLAEVDCGTYHVM